MTDLGKSVKTITFDNIRFYIVKQLNDFYISRKEVYQFFGRKISVSLKGLFNIKDNYPKDVGKLEDISFVIDDNDKEIKMSGTFLKIKDLVDVIDFYSKNNMKYSQKYKKFRNYIDSTINLLNSLGKSFESDLDNYYRLKFKSEDKAEAYYIVKVLQGINKSANAVNVFQSTTGDLRLEVEHFLNNIGYYSTTQETDLTKKAINVEKEFSSNYGKCFLDNNTVVRPVEYVTFIGLEQFFSSTFPQLYSAYRNWYETIVCPAFESANKVKKLGKNGFQDKSNVGISNSVIKVNTPGRVPMKDDVSNMNNLKLDNCKKEEFQIDENIYKDILQIYESSELKEDFKTVSTFINALLKQSVDFIKEKLKIEDKEIEKLEQQLSKAKSSRVCILKNLLK